MGDPEGRSDATGRSPWESDVAARPSLVRPYTLTGGRTVPRVDLPLEAPIGRADPSLPARWPSKDVRTQILTLSDGNPSVAEIAAKISLPLGVARVLIGDLVTQGYLRVHSTLSESSTDDERRDLIGRTLRGLRAL